MPYSVSLVKIHTGSQVHENVSMNTLSADSETCNILRDLISSSFNIESRSSSDKVFHYAFEYGEIATLPFKGGFYIIAYL